MHINIIKLNRTIKYSGVKLSVLAIRLGISRTTLWSRLNNKSEFTPEEIRSLVEALRLNEDEREEIFGISSKSNYIPKRVYHQERNDRS